MRKILFLDFDGVLNDIAFDSNVAAFPTKYNFAAKDRVKRVSSTKLNPLAIENLKYILKEDPDVRIVVSSSWRKHFNLVELQWMLKKHGVPAEKIIGKTGVPPEGVHEGTGPQDIQRGDLCIKWAEENLVDRENFVCVDDDGDFDRCIDRLVRTNYKNGLIRTKAEAILKLFGSFSEPANDFARDPYLTEPEE